MWALGGCMISVMIYMWFSCPNTTLSLFSGAVAGLVGLATEQWSCKLGLRNWVQPALQSLFTIDRSNPDKADSSVPGPLGFPMGVICVYAGAGFWMGSIAHRLLETERRCETATATSAKAGLQIMAPNWAVGSLQAICCLALYFEKPWQQSMLVATIGCTLVSNIHSRAARRAAVFWAVISGFYAFFFEVYATGGIDPGFAIWRYNRENITNCTGYLPVPFFSTAPASSIVGYIGLGLCIFGCTFLHVPLSELRRKLFSSHDKPFNIHKTLGIYCLIHFFYRFAQAGASDMGFNGSWWSLASLVPHAMLSLSSLIFSIPKRRITEGSRIWPEFRLHNIVRST